VKLRQTSTSILVWTPVISALVCVASLLGLLDPHIYGEETRNWATQAKGQDVGNLIAVVSLLVSGYLFYKGSYPAALVWVGTLLYLIYAYIVYAFAVHFNGLFLVYVATLGLSSYALMLSLNGLRAHEGKSAGSSARRFASCTLIAIGAVFTVLWLSDLIPALIAGEVPRSVMDAGLWVNPIHVIDLAVVLPAFILVGCMTLKGRRDGLFFISPWLVFSALMAGSIVAAMVMVGVGEGSQATLPAAVMVAAVAIISSVAAWRYLRQIG
jgi:hypothetical protein